MAGHLFSAFLAVLALALTAAGFVIEQFAWALWIVAAVLGVLTIVAFVWERNRVRPQSATRTRASTEGDQSPAIAVTGDRNTVSVGLPPISPAAKASGLDRLLDRRLGEGDALRERLAAMRVNSYAVNELIRDTLKWQKRCVRTVSRCASSQAASFKFKAGPYQSLYGQPGWTKKGNWRVPLEASLERWMAALLELHS